MNEPVSVSQRIYDELGEHYRETRGRGLTPELEAVHRRMLLRERRRNRLGRSWLRQHQTEHTKEN